MISSLDIDASTDIVVPLIVNIISTVLVVTFGKLRRRLLAAIERRSPKLMWVPFALAALLFAAGAFTTLVLAHSRRLPFWALAALLLVGVAGFAWVTLAELRRFWSVGIRSADKSVKDGIDYARSLALVHDDLEFLGTGASKLTAEPGFEDAVRRCTSAGHRVKFLLSRPDAANVRAASQRRGRDPDDHQRTIVTSLRRLKELQAHRGIDIEVRFYGGESAFRLMFIDAELCLVSYNVYGGQPAQNLPQLTVVDLADATKSYYWAFKRHFDLIWQDADSWDFRTYLT